MYKNKFLLQLHVNIATMYINLTIYGCVCVCVCVCVCDNVIDNCTSVNIHLFLTLGVVSPQHFSALNGNSYNTGTATEKCFRYYHLK